MASFEFIYGQRGARLLARQGYKYYKQRNEAFHSSRWRCCERSCRSNLLLDVTEKVILEDYPEHPHEACATLLRQAVANRLKATEDHLAKWPREIVRCDLPRVSGVDKLDRDDRRLIGRTISRHNKRHRQHARAANRAAQEKKNNPMQNPTGTGGNNTNYTNNVQHPPSLIKLQDAMHELLSEEAEDDPQSITLLKLDSTVENAPPQHERGRKDLSNQFNSFPETLDTSLQEVESCIEIPTDQEPQTPLTLEEIQEDLAEEMQVTMQTDQPPLEIPTDLAEEIQVPMDEQAPIESITDGAPPLELIVGTSSDLNELKSVVQKLVQISDKLAAAAFGDHYDEFAKYLASLLRGIPQKKFKSLKKKLVTEVIRARINHDHLNVFDIKNSSLPKDESSTKSKSLCSAPKVYPETVISKTSSGASVYSAPVTSVVTSVPQTYPRTAPKGLQNVSLSTKPDDLPASSATLLAKKNQEPLKKPTQFSNSSQLSGVWITSTESIVSPKPGNKIFEGNQSESIYGGELQEPSTAVISAEPAPDLLPENLDGLPTETNTILSSEDDTAEQIIMNEQLFDSRKAWN